MTTRKFWKILLDLWAEENGMKIVSFTLSGPDADKEWDNTEINEGARKKVLPSKEDV